jgi:hypothetical protein
MEVASIMTELVDPAKKTVVRFKDALQLHHFLMKRKFRLIEKKKYGPRGGWMLFYLGPRLVNGHYIGIRVKTLGDKHDTNGEKWRSYEPHMSVTAFSGDMRFKEGEIGKFDVSGTLRPKKPEEGASEAEQLEWAEATHISFEVPWLWGAEDLRETYGDLSGNA